MLSKYSSESLEDVGVIFDDVISLPFNIERLLTLMSTTSGRIQSFLEISELF